MGADGVIVKINQVSIDPVGFRELEIPTSKCPIIAGDILVVKGSDLLSGLIRRAEHSSITHAALAIDAEHIIEAVLFAKIKIVKNYYKTYTLLRADITESQRQELVKNARTFVGKRFDYYNAFLWLMRLVLKNRNLFPNPNSERRLFCSELVDRVYQASGIDLLPNRETGNVLPIDFLKSPLLHEVDCTDKIR